MCDPVARMLDLRLRYHRNPEARAYVDRALAIVAKASADEADLSTLDCEIACLTHELRERFAPPEKLRTQ
jgi:hypothetical protein